ncbi:hypothetical protein ID866_7159, partial [Astraeus odoratus]
MVNGLVDPLQVGAFARSIASIAAQLGLPSWLVELRHAATHEDLPSLELLREAARESLAWLFHNYFQPTLNPSSTLPPPVPLRPVIPLLKSYKHLMKTITRDASLRKRHKGDIDAIIRDIERWVAEARVSIDLSNDVLAWGFDQHSGDFEGDSGDSGALEILCDALLAPGALVPSAKKKRRSDSESFVPTAPSIAVWSLLFDQLRVHHPSFPSVFVSRAISTLLEDGETNAMDVDTEGSSRDDSYDEYLARWVVWVIQSWDDTSGGENQLRKEVFLTLSPSMLPRSHVPTNKTKVLTTLLRAITSGFKNLEVAAEFLFATTRASAVESWKTDDLTEMNHRLEVLSSYDVAMEESERNQEPASSITSPPVAQSGPSQDTDKTTSQTAVSTEVPEGKRPARMKRIFGWLDHGGGATALVQVGQDPTSDGGSVPVQEGYIPEIQEAGNVERSTDAIVVRKTEDNDEHAAKENHPSDAYLTAYRDSGAANEALDGVSCMNDKCLQVLKGFKTLVDTVGGPLAKLHPIAGVAVGLLTNAVQTIVDQDNRDESVSVLLAKVQEVYEFLLEKHTLDYINTKEHVLVQIAQVVGNCAEFVSKYSERKGFVEFKIDGMTCARDVGLMTTKKCLDGTRGGILADIMLWIGDPNP